MHKADHLMEQMRKKVNAKETRCSSGFLFAYSKVENHIVTMV